VIETTGMADPGPILANLMNEPVIESVYRLDAVVVTVDSVYGLQQLEQNKEALKQAAVADVLLITKTDLADSNQITTLQQKLSAINASATQHTIQHGQVNPQWIIDVGLFDATTKKAQPLRWLRAPAKSQLLPQQAHDDDIRSFTVTLPSPIHWRDLKPVILKLCQQHGEQLLRLKGIIHATDQKAPLAIHAVHFTPYPPTLLEDWTEDNPHSRIVLIGKNLNEAEVRKLLTQF